MYIFTCFLILALTCFVVCLFVFFWGGWHWGLPLLRRVFFLNYYGGVFSGDSKSFLKGSYLVPRNLRKPSVIFYILLFRRITENPIFAVFIKSISIRKYFIFTIVTTPSIPLHLYCFVWSFFCGEHSSNPSMSTFTLTYSK